MGEHPRPRGNQSPVRESSEFREAEQRGMLGQGTIKTLDYPCCRKLGTRHKAWDKVRNKNYNKGVTILHQVFSHCSTIEGESELSRNNIGLHIPTTPILYLHTGAVMRDLTVEQCPTQKDLCLPNCFRTPHAMPLEPNQNATSDHYHHCTVSDCSLHY